MKLLFSSFGLGGGGLFSNYFYRMPPTSIVSFGMHFEPDYPILFLFDSFVIDRTTFKKLSSVKDRSYYLKIKLVIEALNATNRLEIKDFDNTFKNSQDLIITLVEYLLDKGDRWWDVYEEAKGKWKPFAKKIKLQIEKKRMEEMTFEEIQLMRVVHLGETLSHDLSGRMKILNKKKFYKPYRLNILKEHLSYVTNNLLLCDKYDVAIHDWADFEPFYREQFRILLRSYRTMEKSKQIRQLFNLVFPQFELKDSLSLARALDDPRIDSLRTLVDDVIEGKEKFNQEFARRTLQEVLGIEKKVIFYRNLTGWLTLPISFIPTLGTLLQKGAEVGISKKIESQMRNKKPWFYLISNLSKNYNNKIKKIY